MSPSKPSDGPSQPSDGPRSGPSPTHVPIPAPTMPLIATQGTSPNRMEAVSMAKAAAAAAHANITSNNMTEYGTDKDPNVPQASVSNASPPPHLLVLVGIPLRFLLPILRLQTLPSSLPITTVEPPNIPNTPFISYATQAGLANHIPSSQPIGEHVVPTFHSEWAHVAPEETRSVREDVLETMQSRDHTRIVSSFLSGVHEWYPVPTNNMSYKYYVETDREDVRPGVARFKIMMIQYKETAHEAWSRFVESRQWSIVPKTLRCDRTFCRDSFDCYYVDAMDREFENEHEPSPSECPLFRHDVLNRWWNGFSRKPDFLFELFVRTSNRALVSYDAYETAHYTDDELRHHFPGVPGWMLELDIPAGIHLPLAPVAYYLASDLREGADPTRYRRAHWFLNREHTGLVVAFLYNEMMHGGRQWVLTPSAINTLREYCLPLDVVKGVPTGNILNMMMGSRVRDPTFWNTYKAEAAAIPDFQFVDCEQGSGEYLPWMTGNGVELATMESRRVRIALRQHRRVQVRRSSLLSLRLLIADLVRVPGRENFVRDKNWLQVDSIRVYDLISKLFAKTMRQTDCIKKLEHDLRSTKFDRDGIRAALQDSERDIDRVRHKLQSERRRNDFGHLVLPSPHRSRPNITLLGHANRGLPQARSPFIVPGSSQPGMGALPRVPRRPPSPRYPIEGQSYRIRHPHYGPLRSVNQ